MTSAALGSTLHPVMDPDDSPLRLPDALAALTKQDLDPLSVAELESRIAALEGEITRTRRHMDRAATHRASADALFKR
ncbi:DUF1192 domain-containing protein [Sphingomonas zeae]